MLDPSEMGGDDDLHDCLHCSHQTAWLFQLYHHIQNKHNNVHSTELFHAIAEPEQFSCISCDYTSHCQLNLYEHYKQVHDPRNRNDECRSFCEEFDKYLCHNCRYESDSSLSLVMHRCEKMPRHRKVGFRYFHHQIDARTLKYDVTRTKQHKRRSKSKMMTIPTRRDLAREQSYAFKCNQCSYRAKSKLGLDKHMVQHARQDKKSGILLKKHKHEQTFWFQCNHCSHRSKQKGNLKRHILLRHSASNNGSNLYHCHLCLYRVKFKSRLTVHMLSKHAKDDKDAWFPCDRCPFQTKSEATLDEHRLQHASEGETDWLQCDHCPYRNKLKTNLKRHMLMHASHEESDWLDSMLNMSKILRTHMRHEQTDWFQCNRCSYRAELKSHLIEHVAVTHDTSKQGGGETADVYRAEQEAQWRIQVAKHEQLNRFACDVCPYRAKQKAHLQSHMLQHAGSEEIAWFQCDRCSYRAKRKYSLKTHMAKHETNQKINWFQCDRCSFGAKYETTLKMHMLECPSTSALT